MKRVRHEKSETRKECITKTVKHGKRRFRVLLHHFSKNPKKVKYGT